MLKNIENQAGSLIPGSKRSADAMLQYVGAPLMSPSTETVVSDSPSDTENSFSQLKRPRVYGDGATNGSPPEKIRPSRVIHVRNLPHDTNESEIMYLASQHGQVINLILMRNKRQAFVEMRDIPQATNFLRHHMNPVCPALVRGLPVQIQYSSTYSELKPGQRSHASGMKPTPVLHVNVDNLIVPVTLSILQKVFSTHGSVEKIITFTKNQQFQALIQMSDVESAEAAKQNLDGRNVYPNGCVLRIDFSKMISVNVKYNNEKSRDFTNADLPSGDDAGSQPPAAPSPALGQLFPNRPLGIVPYTGVGGPLTALPGVGQYRFVPGTINQMFGLPPQSPLQAARPIQLTHPRLPMGQLPTADPQSSAAAASQFQQLHMQQLLLNQLHSNQYSGMALPAASQYQIQQLSSIPTTAQQLATANQLQAHQLLHSASSTNQTNETQQMTNPLQGHPITANQLQEHQMRLRVPPQLPPGHQLMQQYAPANGMTPAMVPVSVPSLVPVGDIRTPSPNSQMPANSSVVLVSNLNSQKVSPDALFTLFGMYGDVMRVKILYHKLDTAMVQYAEHSMALLACKFLDRTVFWENEVRVMMSKHSCIQLPAQESHREGSKLTKDYTSSTLHRYMRAGTRNFSNIYPPCNTLHLSSLPVGMQEEDSIVKEFSNYGTVLAFKFFAKDRRMALIQMTSIPQAIEALIGMHNFSVDGKHSLRVSFSKSPIQL